MDAELKKDFERLHQTAALDNLRRIGASTDFIDVYLSDRTATHGHGLLAALVPSAAVENVMESEQWSLSHHSRPSSESSSETESDASEYLPFGNESGLEPLVVEREYYQIRPDGLELREDFRLFHNLYFIQE